MITWQHAAEASLSAHISLSPSIALALLLLSRLSVTFALATGYLVPALARASWLSSALSSVPRLSSSSPTTLVRACEGAGGAKIRLANANSNAARRTNRVSVFFFSGVPPCSCYHVLDTFGCFFCPFDMFSSAQRALELIGFCTLLLLQL